MSLSSINQSLRDVLSERFQQGRYNGHHIGKVVCIDNLGKDYDEEKIKSQLLVLFPEIVKMRLSCEHHRGKCFQWGWCCIEFRSVETAVKSLRIFDHVYLRVGCENILRPLLAHFPNWEQKSIDLELAGKYDGCALSLHLGQPSNMDRFSWNFMELERTLKKTRQSITEQTIEQLKRHLPKPLKVQAEDKQQQQQQRQDFPKKDLQTIWLKNVSLDVSEQELFPFFQCFDERVVIRRLTDPFTNNLSDNVFVVFSSMDRAKNVLQDLQSLMLLSRNIRPMTASVLDLTQDEGFESVFDQALISTGWKLEHCETSSDLVIVNITQSTQEDEENAKNMRSVLDQMQHQRSAFHNLKYQKRLQLAQKLFKQLAKVQQNFQSIDNLIKDAEFLCD